MNVSSFIGGVLVGLCATAAIGIVGFVVISTIRNRKAEKMAKRYYYMVTYFFTNGNNDGYGTMEVFNLDSPITTHEHISKIQDYVKMDQNFSQVVLMNFIPLRTELVEK